MSATDEALANARTSSRARALRIAAAAVLALSSVDADADQPASKPEELWPALTRCWRPPTKSEGAEITVLLRLNDKGELMDSPRIASSKLTGDDSADRAFVASVLAGLAQCIPAEMTDELGRTVNGQPITLRFGRRPT